MKTFDRWRCGKWLNFSREQTGIERSGVFKDRSAT